jgi:hypothetical protein
MSHINRKHPLFKEVMGLGNRILIPNLNMDGVYGMTAFEQAGFCSLAAVPITTYKVLGILGVADKKKRKFGNDFVQLLAVIASMIGVSLTKTAVTQKILPEYTSVTETSIPDTSTYETRDIESGPVPPAKANSPIIERNEERPDPFSKHVRKMGRFRKQHK